MILLTHYLSHIWLPLNAIKTFTKTTKSFSLFIWRLINLLSFASILCSSRQYALNLVARLKFVILVLHLAPEIGGD